MIGKLSGIIDSFHDNHLILDVGGVGYVVHASQNTLRNHGQSGETASFLIETQVREDAITLYGFASREEQEWFKMLNSVQGVGAKAALAILTVCPAERLGTIIAAQDKAMITKADGVGPKLATRILTELKDKAGKLAMSAPVGADPVKAEVAQPTGNGAPSAGSDAHQDALSALTNLGYGRSESYDAIAKAQARHPDGELQTLITSALKELSA